MGDSAEIRSFRGRRGFTVSQRCCGGWLLGVCSATLLANVLVLEAASEETGKQQQRSALEQVRDFIGREAEAGRISTTNEQWRLHLPRFPVVAYRGDTIYVHLETDRGNAKIRLQPLAAPNHVANFMYLTALGFYDGMAFQYMLSGERVQTGCPVGDGSGTPGYSFAGEFGLDLKHDRAGLLSMMNAGRNTDGCQFFITLGPMPWMDGKHTLFGEVLEGMDVLDEISKAGVPRLGIPKEKIHIRRAWIEEETEGIEQEVTEGMEGVAP